MELLQVFRNCQHEDECECYKSTRAERRRWRRERGVHAETPIQVVAVKRCDNPNPRAA